MPETHPPQAPRRGAPCGNHNARKHGFYARRLPSDDRRNFSAALQISLRDEITLLRCQLRRFIESALQPESGITPVEFIRTVSLAALAINSLVRTQAKIPADSESALDRAIREISREMHRESYLKEHPEDPQGLGFVDPDDEDEEDEEE